MNYLLKSFRTKAYQPINQPKNIYYKFPFAHEGASGVITLTDEAVTRFSVIRHGDSEKTQVPKGIETPYFSLIMEINKESTPSTIQELALFQEKEDAFMAQSKITSALLRPTLGFIKKIFLVFFILFLVNLLSHIVIGHPLVSIGTSPPTANADAAQKLLTDLLARKAALAQMQNNGGQQPQVPPSLLPGEATLPVVTNPQEQAPVQTPGSTLLNDLKDKK